MEKVDESTQGISDTIVILDKISCNNHQQSSDEGMTLAHSIFASTIRLDNRRLFGCTLFGCYVPNPFHDNVSMLYMIVHGHPESEADCASSFEDGSVNDAGMLWGTSTGNVAFAVT